MTLTQKFSADQSESLAAVGDRYVVTVEWLDGRKRFVVSDGLRANATVASFDSLRQASVESSFLSLLHLQSTHRVNKRPRCDSGI